MWHFLLNTLTDDRSDETLMLNLGLTEASLLDWYAFMTDETMLLQGSAIHSLSVIHDSPVQDQIDFFTELDIEKCMRTV